MRTSSLGCVEVVVRVARLDQVEQRDTRHGSRSASRSVLYKLGRRHAEHGGVVAVAVDGDVSRSDSVVASRHSCCLRTREHELVSS